MAKNWALVIGINDYNPVNFAPLNYAKQDAERVKDFFSNAGFEVCFFADDSPPLTLPTGHTIPTQPTYGNLITFLQDRFESPFLSTGDNCWFFFAGHGERHQDRDYLMPIDANSRGTEVIAGLTVNYVKERLSRCGADNVIMILDACRSQGSRDGLGIGRDNQKGVITLASCQPTQKAWEIEELRQGAFTYAFLEALQLSGERSCATVERLGNYLKQRVPALCQQYGKAPAQVPRISVDPIEKQHFILIPQYARQADIDLLKLDVHRYKQTNPALAAQICIRLNALAMGADLEVMNLWAQIRSQIQNRVIQEADNIQTPATEGNSTRSTTASTTTINNVLEEDFSAVPNSLDDSTTDQDAFGMESLSLDDLLNGSTPDVPPSDNSTTDQDAFGMESLSLDDLLNGSTPDVPSSDNSTTDQDLLELEKGVNYSKLQDLLRAGDWKAADYETYLLMLEAVGRQEGDWIRDDELLDFPCADLLTIDRLWVKYSQGRFGFSVQKQIYVECGATLDGKYSGKKVWRRFGNKVGWRVDDSWIDYHNVYLGTSAPSNVSPLGQFPARVGWCVRGGIVVGWRLWGILFRIENCQLKT